MPDLLKITLTLVFITVLLRKKIQVGYVLLLGAALMALLYLLPPRKILEAILAALKSNETWKLIIALTTIKGFEMILREKEIMKRMMAASRGLLKKRKAVIVSMPLLIGMLPSIGGAYFSAPMVEESAKGLKLPPEEKGFINYWFRHPWEYILPLYPGIVLASTISGQHLRGFIGANLPYSIMVALTGFLFSMRGIDREKTLVREKITTYDLLSFAPIVFVISLVVIFGIELQWGLLIAFVLLLIVFRYKPRDSLRVIKHALEPDVLVLIGGVMIFKEVMEVSGAVANLSHFLTAAGIPLMFLLFFVPFTGGLLTGITVGFVGSTFPLIMSLPGGTALPALSFAFAAGFLGVLLSPVHICFILTREYFKADLWGMYRRMLPSAVLIFAVAVAEYLIFR
jgi:integral membrane protein (TIGR00529 family)